MPISATTSNRDPERNQIIDRLQGALKRQVAGQNEIKVAESKRKEGGYEVDRCLEELTKLEDGLLGRDVEAERNQIVDRLQDALKKQMAGQDDSKAAESKIEHARDRVCRCLKELAEL